jgi:hypothetical protein
MIDVSGTFYFAGLGFTTLDVNIVSGGISSGQLSNQSYSQPCSDISYDSTTGQVGFAVAESQQLVRNILFTGNVINDGSGNPVGLSGTWKGDRVIVIRTEGAALPVQPPPSTLTVEGYWAAVLEPQQN